MKRYRLSILFGVCFLSSIVSSQETIRICSFNIAELGEGNHAATRDEEGIAGILHTIQPDLIAIQEVGVAPECFEQVEVIKNHLNHLADQAGGAVYLSDITDEFATGDERYVFLWRPPVQIVSSIMKMADTEIYQGTRFVRTPVYAYFKAGSFDFALMNVHLYTRIENGDRGRKFEYEELVKWIRHTSANTDEQDILVVGDFNRHLDGGSFPKTSAWEYLAFPGYQEEYRFVLLEAIPGGVNVVEAPEDKYSTTIAARRSIYDQIIVSRGAFREFGEQAAWDKNVGIEPFDNYPEYASCTTRQLKYIISDHRPIWFDLRIDMEDDDGIAEEEPDENQPAACGPYLGPVIGNKNSKIYHHPNSPSVSAMTAGNKKEFATVIEAEEAGYRAAKNWDWNR